MKKADAEALKQGSSPLTRGKPVRAETRRAPTGLIPAHAGKTRSAWSRSRSARAHPRSRGENDFGRRPRVSVKGSSPLTRGKRVGVDAGCAFPGLIPAHAGKTSPSVGSWTTSRAHPRSRGENDSTRNNTAHTAGSSPLTRGKPVRGGGRGRASGLIPAHAGKTSGRPSWLGPFGAHPRSRGEN